MRGVLHESRGKLQVNQTIPQSEATPDPPSFLDVADDFGRRRLAWRRRKGRKGKLPGLVWLGGFKSDMLSTKAARLDAFAAARGQAYLRFDYSGHGESAGDFADGTISQWLADALAILRALTQGPQILVGSSMGGWISLLIARELARTGESQRLAGLVLIAPAVDFTEALLWAQLPEEARRAIIERGVWMRPSPYSPEPYPITRRLVEDGRSHLLLGQTVRAHCPVHILQGMQDPDVPWSHAVALVEHLAGDPVALTLIKDGDHRLSRDEDIARLLKAVESIG
jgi:pimeloyl-ACP methyl ester carboxylesterase